MFVVQQNFVVSLFYLYWMNEERLAT